MPRFPQQLPTGQTRVDERARELLALTGFQGPDGSNHADDARALGELSATAHERQTSGAGEAFTTRTSALLPEWEDALAASASTGANIEARRAALTAIRRAGGKNSRGAFLRALRAIDPLATFVTGSVLENLSYPRGVFVFTVRVSAAVLADAAQRARVVDVVERMKPLFFDYRLAAREGFFYDDPDSTFDSGDTLAR